MIEDNPGAKDIRFANEGESARVVKVGYARVSAEDENLDIQVEALKRAGCKRIYKETVSSGGRTRPEFEKMMHRMHKDDVLIIWRLDRLVGSTRMLLETVERLEERGANFKSLQEPWADTTSSDGRLLMTFFSGMAEFERDLIREKTGVGRKAAFNRGVKFGRPGKLTDDQVKHAKKLLKQGKSSRFVADIFGVHFTTLYRYLRG
jgi:DNA invertase Pin-like site-specific DNA recombinase